MSNHKGGEVEYAMFWRRVVAFLIDVVLAELTREVVLAIYKYFLYNVWLFDQLPFGFTLYKIISWTATSLYFTIFTSSRWQATPGKILMKIYVVDQNFKKLSFFKSFIRYWLYLLSLAILFIGFVMAAFTEKKQALHDLILKTYVVYGRPNQTNS